MTGETTRAANWLVSREPHPRTAREAWAKGLPATLRAGRHFAAVHAPAAFVESGIIGIRDRDAVERHFRTAGINSAVIVSRRQHQYTVLVPATTALTWNEPGTHCLGNDHWTNYLAVPPPVRREPPGAHWLFPAPHDDVTLADPVALRLLLGRSKSQQNDTLFGRVHP
ncbi:hypothetical protein I5Q34_22925 [Streptomyces sp. AV19]|uniref:hypothetical protein n=1 Tax=Streptomyces sp. AV19 TaxID=2793068 RepID=UPI0018FEA681|nr:hypothetical protein [Streptomyces sp. AV19]MBH1937086.1 hypothetical protein [Streptomyces sp. AV19]MDG4533112.1 hypothetical protein [Streptomyces sp. AV19]